MAKVNMSNIYVVFRGNDCEYGRMPDSWEVIQYPTEKLVLARSFFQCLRNAKEHDGPFCLVNFPAQGVPYIMAWDGPAELRCGKDMDDLWETFVETLDRYEAAVAAGVEDQ